MSSQKKQAVRPVHIVARYFILKNHGKYQVGDVVLLVRNDKGVEYLVTIAANGDNACSCPATKKCYHLTYCEVVESALQVAAGKALDGFVSRQPTEKQPARKVAAKLLKLRKEVEAICAEAEAA